LLRKITAAVVALGVTAAIVVVPEAIVAASPVHAPRKTALPVHPRSTRAQRLGIPRATESCRQAADSVDVLSHAKTSNLQCLDALRPHVDVPVSQDTLVWVAIASQNKVELVDQSTGAIIGTPISLPGGSDPVALAYWAPSAANYQYTVAENRDPYVLVADHGTDKVSFIDAATKQYVTSISLGGAAPTTMSIAASTTSDFAAVTDNTTGGHSRVSMIEVPGQTVFATFPNVASTTNALGQIIFDASGTWVYVTAPAAHQVHAFECGTYSCSAETTLTGSSTFDPIGLAVDWTTPSSATLYVTSNSSSGQNLESWADDGATWGTGTTIASFGVAPSALAISSGAQVAYVSLPSDSEVEAYSLSASSVLGYETGIDPGPMALSWDSGTLLAGDATSGSDELGLAHTSAFGSTFAETAMAGQVSAIAVPVAAYVYYDIVAITDGTGGSSGFINVIDSATGATIEQYPDYNTPEAVVASPNGQEVYVVDSTGGGTSGTEPEVNVLSTADFGTATDPITVVYPIAQSATTPFSYSLTHAPVPKSVAISPNGDSLLITDSANSDVLTMDFSVPDAGGAWEGAVTSVASLNGSTAETPTSIAVSPDGSYAYVTSHPSSGAGGITELSYAATGHGTYAHDAYQAGSSFAADPAHESATTLVDPLSIVVASDDRSAYVLDGYSSEPLLDQFATATNGTLATSSIDALPAGTTPVSFTMSPEDNVAYVSDSSTDKTTAIDLTSGSFSFGDSLYAETQEGTAGVTGSTPDGQYFATGNGPTSDDGVEIGSTGSGAALEFVTLPNQPVGMAISPVSSSQWLSTSLVYAGGLSWPEELGGAGNPSEPAMSSIADVNSAGTPSDAPGLSAGTNTSLHSYTLSLNSFSISDVGLPLDVAATYDSAYMAYGIDTSSSIPSFAFGWRLSTGITWTQNPDSGFFPCRITVTQADGSQIYFEPAAAIFSSCSGLTYEALPWEQDTLALSGSTCSGSDYCWIVTNTETGEQYYMDSNSSSSHQLVKEVDRNGNTISFTYTSGKLTSEAGAGSRSISFSYPAGGTSPCPSTFNGQTIAKCMVATDPLSRTATFMLVGSTSTGYDLQGVTLAAPSGWSTPSSTYAFSYSSHYLTSWWDPNNYEGYAGNTAEATDVTYGAGHFVTQVTGPEVTDQGTAMNATFTPTTTYSYPLFDPYSGSGTVITTDANANYDIANSASLPGANVTFDNYQNWMLAGTVQGYGPTDAALPDSMSSNTITTQRDPFTLMPVETINPLADTTSTSTSVTDLGISFDSYDANANLIASETPGSTPDSWNTTSYYYNDLNEPLSSTDADGNVTLYTYNSTGQVLATTSPSTNQWTAASISSDYSGSDGLLCASRTPDEVATYGTLSSCSSSHATTYTYDSAGDLTSTTDPLGDVSESAFDADGDTCAHLSPDGYADGQALSSCPSSATNNETVTLERNVLLSPTEATSPANAAGGTTWTYYDTDGNQIASVSPMGNPSMCNPLTTSTCVYTSYAAFDAMGEGVSNTSQTSVSGTPGPTTTSFFDPDGNLVGGVSPEGNISGSPASYEDASVPSNMGTEIASTPAANLGLSTCSVTSTTSPCPNTEVTTYDPMDESTGTVTANGGESGSTATSTTSTYNPDSTDADSTVPTPTDGALLTTTVNDPNGNQLESTSTSGSTTVGGSTTTYEPNGKSCWSSPLPWTGSGSPLCGSPPTGSGTDTTFNYYDASGNLLAVSGPGSNPYATGNTSGCDPLATSTCSFTTYYTFDEDARLATTTQPSDYQGNYPLSTDYYDPSGSLVAVTGAAGSPGTCNPLVTSTCADTTYKTYDATGRVTQVEYTDGTPTVTFSYNNDGTVSQMIDGTGTTSYSYDDLGRLTSKTDGSSNTVTYGYDEAGKLNCMSYPNSSNNTCSTSGAGSSAPPVGDVTYTYDTQERLASIISWVTTAPSTYLTLTYAYDCAGYVYWVSTGTTSGTPCIGTTPAPLAPPSATAAVTTLYEYTNGQETSIATSTANGATPLLGFTLAYNGDNLITSSSPQVNSTTPASDAYTYDSSNRVSTGPILGSSGVDAYSYTPNNSLTADTTAFQSAAYSQNGELCWSLPGSSSNACGTVPSGATGYAYDASGDLVSVTPSSGNDQSLGWEQASGRLVCANSNGTTCSTSSPTSTTMVYTYNGQGKRATSTYGGGGTTTFVWDGLQSRLLSNGSSDYIYGSNQSVPVMQISADGSTPVVDLLCQDSNDNTRGIVQLTGGTSSYDGTLVAYTDYDAFGNPITAAGGSANPGGLTQQTGGYTFSTTNSGFGASFTDQTGLDYLLNRFYEPATGQFLSIDPQLAQTQQPYQYAQDNPVNSTDPTGLWDVRTEGYCLSVSAHVAGFFDLGLEGCVVQTLSPQHPQTAITLTVSGDVSFGYEWDKAEHAIKDEDAFTGKWSTGFSIGLNLGYQQSAQEYISEAGGPDTYHTTSVSFLGWTASYTYGKNASCEWDIGYSWGPGAPAVASVSQSVGRSYTWLFLVNWHRSAIQSYMDEIDFFNPFSPQL
jgi:RHS repeat-associated protein